jgi:hypothetical protein
MLKFIKNIFFKKRLSTRSISSLKHESEEKYKENNRPDGIEDLSPNSQQYYHQPKPLIDITFIYCLVGNVVEERFSKTEQKVYKGTKHFSSGTKVYCFPPLWGDGYENIKVIGRHRNSTRMVTMIIPSKHVTNWRVKTVYHPFIIEQMSQNAHLYSTESHKEDMLSLAASLNKK